jgi:hypothetical protein
LRSLTVFYAFVLLTVCYSSAAFYTHPVEEVRRHTHARSSLVCAPKVVSVTLFQYVDIRHVVIAIHFQGSSFFHIQRVCVLRAVLNTLNSRAAPSPIRTCFGRWVRPFVHWSPLDPFCVGKIIAVRYLHDTPHPQQNALLSQHIYREML